VHLLVLVTISNTYKFVPLPISDFQAFAAVACKATAEVYLLNGITKPNLITEAFQNLKIGHYYVSRSSSYFTENVSCFYKNDRLIFRKQHCLV
jgi:hypothetical protein